MQLSGANRLKRALPDGYYQTLISRLSELDEHVQEEIEKDVDRTFPNHELFSSQYLEQLRRVLSAYALHNPDIGYCQSLNFLCGTMILLLSEEDSFYLLITMVEHLLPSDYYTPSMIGTSLYTSTMVFIYMT